MAEIEKKPVKNCGKPFPGCTMGSPIATQGRQQRCFPIVDVKL